MPAPLSNASSAQQKREQPRPWFLRGRFWGAACFSIAIGFFVVNTLGLVGTVIIDSFGTHWFGGTWLPQGFTTDWYAYETRDPSSR